MITVDTVLELPATSETVQDNIFISISPYHDIPGETVRDTSKAVLLNGAICVMLLQVVDPERSHQKTRSLQVKLPVFNGSDEVTLNLILLPDVKSACHDHKSIERVGCVKSNTQVDGGKGNQRVPFYSNYSDYLLL